MKGKSVISKIQKKSLCGWGYDFSDKSQVQPQGNEKKGSQISGNQKARFPVDVDCKCYVDSPGIYYVILNTKKMKNFLFT